MPSATVILLALVILVIGVRVYVRYRVKQAEQIAKRFAEALLPPQ